LALLVREDVAFVIFAFSLLAIIEKRKIKWWLVPAFLSITYFFISMNIINYFSVIGQYKFLFYYSWLGDTWPEIIKNTIFKPWILLPKIFSFGSVVVALGLLLPTAYLALLKPKYLLLSLLIFLQLIVSVGWFWLAMILFTQYSALLLPGIFIATIFGINVLYQSEKKFFLGFLIKEKSLVITILVIAIFYSTIVIGPIFGSMKIISERGIITKQTESINKILNQIPDQASVAATFDLITPLSSRQNVASLNYVFLGKQQFLQTDYALPKNIEYLAIDYTDFVTYQLLYGINPSYQDQYNIAATHWPEIINDFGLISINDSLALYKRGVDNNFSLVKFLDQLPNIHNPQDTNLDEAIKFLGFNKLNDHYQLFWLLDQPLPKTYHLKITLTQQKKMVYEKIYPFGYGLLQAGSDLAKKNIQTNHWFEFSNLVPNGGYDLYLSLIEISQGGLELEATRATKNVIDEETIIGQKIFLEKIIL
tara:strand:- start:1148 stop:2584 length:1437 start_codon:yes stop_codon:yes gene_type:complete